MKSPKILFSSPITPYPPKKMEDDNIDFFYYRSSLKQGIFQMRQMHSWHPLHYLAQNLPCRSMVLENPTFRKFQDKVRRGGYDVVCMTFSIMTSSQILKMCSWVKEYNPEIDIILGGYGTTIFRVEVGIEKEIRKVVDHICQGEGLSFMQDYLEKRWNITRHLPVSQRLIPSSHSLYQTRIPIYKIMHVFMSLGCSNNCSFCATSTQFGKKINLLDGRQLYEVIREQAKLHPGITSLMVFDENFLEDRERIRVFQELMEQDRELAERPVQLNIFSSARSIKQYDMTDLVKCNIGNIFIGVESFCNDILHAEKLVKRGKDEIDIAGLFRDLHAHGINTTGSIVIGWDDHTLESTREELRQFVELNPSLYQIIPLQLVPGSELWSKMEREGRIIEDYSYDTLSLNRSAFQYKNFSHKEAFGLIKQTYHDLANEGGSIAFRCFENILQGIKTLTGSDDEQIQWRVKGYRKNLQLFFLFAFISRFIFFGKNFGHRWRRAMKAAFGLYPVRLTLLSMAGIIIFPLLHGYVLLGMIRNRLLPNGDQPRFWKKAYDNAAAE
jgi:radical SAM superfamily enzyme YgiQ (UPF0313 family)